MGPFMDDLAYQPILARRWEDADVWWKKLDKLGYCTPWGGAWR